MTKKSGDEEENGLPRISGEIPARQKPRAQDETMKSHTEVALGLRKEERKGSPEPGHKGFK